MSLLTQFWSLYNSDESFLPLYLPLCVWVGAYSYCAFLCNSYPHSNKSREFHRWYAVHNLHNGGAIVLGSLSIYSGIATSTAAAAASSSSSEPASFAFSFNERIPILWSLGYFFVDAVDCCVRRDAAYLLHAACCGILGMANYGSPVLRHLRMNSKATYCELSNPFMHLAKSTRNPFHFALFAVVFTCCRILWLPVLYHQLRTVGHMEWNKDFILWLLAIFYGLNLYWWFKILRILLLPSSSSSADDEGGGGAAAAAAATPSNKKEQ